MTQWGITADSSRWDRYIADLHSWLDRSAGPTSIPYRIEGLDSTGVYPRVLTATPVQTTDGKHGWVYGHVISVQDSLLIANREFQDDDCPKLSFLERSTP
jgi:hypothetical protein